jgi:hypothetical protein
MCITVTLEDGTQFGVAMCNIEGGLK